jgi:protein-tyrosine-phosphatase
MLMVDLPSAVLFSCTYNSIRSPMAEAMLKYLHGKRIFIDSAGVQDGDVDGYAVTVMDEIGIDLSRHKSKLIDELEDSSYDLIISLSPQAQHKAVQLTHWMSCDLEYWNTYDPSLVVSERREIVLESYRQCRDQLMARIRERFPVPSVYDI